MRPIRLNDIELEAEIPYLDIKPHPWRRLKTKSSARQLPLVGSSLWAAQRVVTNASGRIRFSSVL